MTICTSARSDGAACQANAGEAGLCFWHDPDRTRERLDAARRGGSRAVLPLTLIPAMDTDEIRQLLSSVLGAMLSGALDAATARAAAYIVSIERRVAEGEVLESRIETLETLLRSRRRAA